MLVADLWGKLDFHDALSSATNFRQLAHVELFIFGSIQTSFRVSLSIFGHSHQYDVSR